MSNYLRPRLPGRPVFFTVCLAQRGACLLTEEIDILREAVRVTRARRPFSIDAWVVLPDHMHAIWTLPADDPNYSDRWGAIKARFSKYVRLKYNASRRPGHGPAYPLPTELPVVRSGRYAGLKPGLRVDKRECAIWQRRFWEHHIRNEADYTTHLRYCWANPVKHGFVDRAVDWPHSSIHRDIRLGRVDPDYSGPFQDGKFGEMP